MPQGLTRVPVPLHVWHVSRVLTTPVAWHLVQGSHLCSLGAQYWPLVQPEAGQGRLRLPLSHSRLSQGYVTVPVPRG